jgi:hypothetical protein
MNPALKNPTVRRRTCAGPTYVGLPNWPPELSRCLCLWPSNGVHRATSQYGARAQLQAFAALPFEWSGCDEEDPCDDPNDRWCVDNIGIYILTPLEWHLDPNKLWWKSVVFSALLCHQFGNCTTIWLTIAVQYVHCKYLYEVMVICCSMVNDLRC